MRTCQLRPSRLIKLYYWRSVMSRVLQPKNKDIVKLNVLKSKDVWEKNKSGKYVLKDKFEYYGKIDKGLSAFVTKTNKKGLNTQFVENTSSLPKKTKNEIVKVLTDKNTKVVYLVKDKKL